MIGSCLRVLYIIYIYTTDVILILIFVIDFEQAPIYKIKITEQVKRDALQTSTVILHGGHVENTNKSNAREIRMDKYIIFKRHRNSKGDFKVIHAQRWKP